jgi:hypothetical protein
LVFVVVVVDTRQMNRDTTHGVNHHLLLLAMMRRSRERETERKGMKERKKMNF